MQGCAAQVAYHILDELGEPYDTSGCTGAYLRVKKQDNTVLEVVASGGTNIGAHPALTIWTFNLTGDEIASLPLGRSDVSIKMAYGDGSTKVLHYPQSLIVSQSV